MKIVFRALFFAGIFFLINSNAQASETVGTINSSYKLTKICKNVSCSDYGNLNWKPTLNGNTSGATAVSVTDAGLTGFLWGDEIGWVNLSPTGAGVSINPSTGALSGTAYASVGGWINFNPTGAGVTLVDNGSGSNFYGYAYVSGINGGWIKFDCADSSTCIKTDWRNSLNRAASSNAGNSNTSGSVPVDPGASSSGATDNPGPVLLPEEAYQNFPGSISNGNNPGLNNGDTQNDNNSPFFNPYANEQNINGMSESPTSSDDLNDENSCSYMKNISCLLRNKYFFPTIIILIIFLLGLIGRKLWRKVY